MTSQINTTRRYYDKRTSPQLIQSKPFPFFNPFSLAMIQKDGVINTPEIEEKLLLNSIRLSIDNLKNETNQEKLTTGCIQLVSKMAKFSNNPKKITDYYKPALTCLFRVCGHPKEEIRKIAVDRYRKLIKLFIREHTDATIQKVMNFKTRDPWSLETNFVTFSEIVGYMIPEKCRSNVPLFVSEMEYLMSKQTAEVLDLVNLHLPKILKIMGFYFSKEDVYLLYLKVVGLLGHDNPYLRRNAAKIMLELCIYTQYPFEKICLDVSSLLMSTFPGKGAKSTNPHLAEGAFQLMDGLLNSYQVINKRKSAPASVQQRLGQISKVIIETCRSTLNVDTPNLLTASLSLLTELLICDPCCLNSFSTDQIEVFVNMTFKILKFSESIMIISHSLQLMSQLVKFKTQFVKGMKNYYYYIENFVSLCEHDDSSVRGVAAEVLGAIVCHFLEDWNLIPVETQRQVSIITVKFKYSFHRDSKISVSMQGNFGLEGQILLRKLRSWPENGSQHVAQFLLKRAQKETSLSLKSLLTSLKIMLPRFMRSPDYYVLVPKYVSFVRNLTNTYWSVSCEILAIISALDLSKLENHEFIYQKIISCLNDENPRVRKSAIACWSISLIH